MVLQQNERFVSRDPNTRIAAAILRLIFGERYAQCFSIRLWDGTVVPSAGTSAFTLFVNDPGALRTAFKPPIDLNAGRAFTAGLLDVDGDVEAAVDELLHATRRPSGAALVQLSLLLRRLPAAPLPDLREARLRGKKHSLQRDRAAIGFHYDQPVEFYRTFLDRNLVYSCAYWDEGIDSLDDAQVAKIEYSLRKLRLRPGERLLDIGCGWGALVVHAAKKFGAYVLGVTLSERQAEEAHRRINAADVGERARVERWDYRQLPDTTFDKIVSIGMVEHVGRDRLPEYFAAAHRLLKPGGLFLNHGIANENPAIANGRASGFIEHFIFPDGELVTISDALQFAERAGFEVRDVENLREHYTRTLRAWVQNIERNRDVAIAAAGEQSYRAWRLYMAGSAQGFRTGRMGLFQSLLAKPEKDGSVPVPATRRDLYTASSGRASSGILR
jgi:cyclopropane-fatty-acyl-phospholipid synthase